MISEFEKLYMKELDRMVYEGVIKSWQGQQTVNIISPITGSLICRYLCDFKVEHNDGMTEWIETKNGHEDGLWGIKKTLMKELYIPGQANEIFNVARRRSNGQPSYLPKERIA